MKKKLICALIASAIVIIYILFADYLYAHGLIALDSIIYKVDMILLYPSYFILAILSGWNRGVLGDVPYYVFKILSFLIYFLFFYFVRILTAKINIGAKNKK